MQAVLTRLPIWVRDRLPDDLVSQADEIRLRIGQPVELRTSSGSHLLGQPLLRDEMDETVRMLADHSIYACEDRIRSGYFALPGGFRVGLTGSYSMQNGVVSALPRIGSISIRMAREIKGAADKLMPHLMQNGRALSTIILSAPMMGKTTMLRDIARQMSELGLHVAISDERSELAGSKDGVPQMDVGPRTDVCDGLPKRQAIPALVRAMAPEVIVTDELGHIEDAEAVQEAARSGVALIASAHAGSYEEAKGRKALASLMEDGLFRRVVVLGGSPGRIQRILNGAGEVI
ncbi:stage III sporulation protein AA [Eubacteriales bacterium OttesenSCG-928-N13]|nr:stage III sporulation protein AA [Eubacteriales bacterium OttesenSCG-928-N13]